MTATRSYIPTTHYRDATPAACFACGAYSGTTLATRAALLAVCDVLVLKALEAIGKRIVRADRSRFGVLDGRPWNQAYLIWRAIPKDLKGLEAHWEVIPAMIAGHAPGADVTVNDVVALLDGYVRTLVSTQTPHSLSLLSEQFTNTLGLQVS